MTDRARSAAPTACPRRVCPPCRATSLLTAAEIARLVAIGCERPRGARGAIHGGRAPDPGDLAEISPPPQRRPPGPARDDHQRDRPRPPRGRALTRDSPHQRLARHRRPRALQPPHPARPAAGRSRRHRPAERAGLAPLKVNAVLMRDTLADAPALLGWAIDNELPAALHRADAARRRPCLGPATTWCLPQSCSALLGTRFELTDPEGGDDPSAPAEEWLVNGGPATVGIIASVTRSFCSACDRTRITAEGTVRSCLFGDDETDLRHLLRTGADGRRVARWWRAAMWGKQAGHGIDASRFRSTRCEQHGGDRWLRPCWCGTSPPPRTRPGDPRRRIELSRIDPAGALRTELEESAIRRGPWHAF